MLLYVFLLLLAVHYAYLVLGIERRKGGYILIAIMMILVLMWSAVFVIQIPVTAANTTEASIFVKGVRDPITAFFLFAQELIDVMIYGSLIKWGRRGDRGWF